MTHLGKWCVPICQSLALTLKSAGQLILLLTLGSDTKTANELI